MSHPKFFWLLLLTTAACSPGQQKPISADSIPDYKARDTSRRSADYPLINLLNQKNISQRGNYFMLTPFSDSSFQINWGNNNVQRVYGPPVDYMFADRLTIKWENKDYLILNYYTGSGVWINTICPLNKKELVQEFTNGIYFDSSLNLLVTEEYADTVLAVRNLKTTKSQFIIEKDRPCDAANNLECIDTAYINNKVLYYKWVTPYISADTTKTSEKKVRIKI